MTHRLTLEQIAAACASGGGERLPMPPDAAAHGGFEQPWQAHVFALTLVLHARGLFSWSHWAATLGAEIQQARAGGQTDDGTDYYTHWTNALERMLIDKGLATSQQIHTLEQAWEQAAARTPHGQPIELLASDTDRLR